MSQMPRSNANPAQTLSGWVAMSLVSDPQHGKENLMHSLSKAAVAIGIIAATALTISTADARSPARSNYDAYDRVDSARPSIPYDAGGIAYGPGQHGHNDSSDFQLQGR
jgi:hypothetical protein